MYTYNELSNTLYIPSMADLIDGCMSLTRDYSSYDIVYAKTQKGSARLRLRPDGTPHSEYILAKNQLTDCLQVTCNRQAIYSRFEIRGLIKLLDTQTFLINNEFAPYVSSIAKHFWQLKPTYPIFLSRTQVAAKDPGIMYGYENFMFDRHINPTHCAYVQSVIAYPKDAKFLNSLFGQELARTIKKQLTIGE